jgi:hypothetical protein
VILGIQMNSINWTSVCNRGRIEKVTTVALCKALILRRKAARLFDTVWKLSRDLDILGLCDVGRGYQEKMTDLGPEAAGRLK